MKNLLIILALTATFSMQACAQQGRNKEVPENVKNEFQTKFPNASKVSWDMENEKEWEAEFKLNGKEYSANFYSDGSWKETEYEINVSGIPTSIRNIIDQNFTDYDIEAAEISETQLGKSYEFAIETNDEEIEVVIDPQGKLTQKKVEDSDDEED